METARWWQAEGDAGVRCGLCPHHCLIQPGARGLCGVRANEGGQLVSLVWSRPRAAHVDPIEKKPLYHFHPGTPVFSIGTVGCNLSCVFCQNWELSTGEPEGDLVAPDQIVRMAQQQGCRMIAYTYNEPTIWGEYVLEVARLARAAGLLNVMVTNGFISPQPRKELYAFIDAANVDLKAFSDAFYRHLCGGHLTPVLDTLRYLHHETPVWLEVTTLLIPGQNDTPAHLELMFQWAARTLGREVPWHLSAYHPAHHFHDAPATPLAALQQTRELALRCGLQYVYLGNVADPQASDTCCPGCGRTLIRRSGYSVSLSSFHPPQCPDCDTVIAGHFDPTSETDSSCR